MIKNYILYCSKILGIRILIYLITLCFYNNSIAQIDDSILYVCKYNYTWQKDSTNPDSKFNDIMYLRIRKNSSEYYSYLKQVGLKNAEDDIASKKTLEYGMQNQSKYFSANESEIIIDYYKIKKIKVLDKLSQRPYYYIDKLEVPNWEIKADTTMILNQSCQKATTTFKGRSYIAWFSNSIPFSLGPWQFTGLPGLILKINDTQDQFIFECTQLTLKPNDKEIFKEYSNCLETTKQKLRELKRLKAVDILSFIQMENPDMSFSASNSINNAPIKHKIKPYNPIDLSK